MKKIIFFICSVLISVAIVSCSNRDMGTVGGAALGGVAGSAITGGSAAGTVAGAVGGGLIGRAVTH